MKFNIANNGAKKKTLSLINKGRERNDGKRFEKSSKKPIKESMTTNVASIMLKYIVLWALGPVRLLV